MESNERAKLLSKIDKHCRGMEDTYKAIPVEEFEYAVEPEFDECTEWEHHMLMKYASR